MEDYLENISPRIGRRNALANIWDGVNWEEAHMSSLPIDRPEAVASLGTCSSVSRSDPEVGPVDLDRRRLCHSVRYTNRRNAMHHLKDYVDIPVLGINTINSDRGLIIRQQSCTTF